MRAHITGLILAGMVGLSIVTSGLADDQGKAPVFGADMSYVNEMEDCHAVFRDAHGQPGDPYQLIHEGGTNWARLRLWVKPDWTPYSTLDDVERSARRVRAAHMKFLLDFHYSDDWADGDHQIIPAAWQGLSPEALKAALYDYTHDTLMALDTQGLMPDMVQLGNEINSELMQPAPGLKTGPIDWDRNGALLNTAIKAVRDVAHQTRHDIKIMIHVAQPENIGPWFAAATRAGVVDYDVIGISYYRRWSKLDMQGLGAVISETRKTYGRSVMVAETAYPFTFDNQDPSPNLMDAASAFAPYGASREGQARYMHDLMQRVLDSGGDGVFYWEPAWVSTGCKTRWGQGSNWDNATFFDAEGKALPVINWPKGPYRLPRR